MTYSELNMEQALAQRWVIFGSMLVCSVRQPCAPVGTAERQVPQQDTVS